MTDYERLLAAVRAVDWDAILNDIFAAGQEFNVGDEDHEKTARHGEWISDVRDALRQIDGPGVDDGQS